jgi:hypothetical protein
MTPSGTSLIRDMPSNHFVHGINGMRSARLYFLQCPVQLHQCQICYYSSHCNKLFLFGRATALGRAVSPGTSEYLSSKTAVANRHIHVSVEIVSVCLSFAVSNARTSFWDSRHLSLAAAPSKVGQRAGKFLSRSDRHFETHKDCSEDVPMSRVVTGCLIC